MKCAFPYVGYAFGSLYKSIFNQTCENEVTCVYKRISNPEVYAVWCNDHFNNHTVPEYFTIISIEDYMVLQVMES